MEMMENIRDEHTILVNYVKLDILLEEYKWHLEKFNQK